MELPRVYVALCCQDAARDLEAGSGGSNGGAEMSDDEYPAADDLRRRSGASPTAAEVARFGAAKERKHALAAAIAAFNRCTLCLRSKGLGLRVSSWQCFAPLPAAEGTSLATAPRKLLLISPPDHSCVICMPQQEKSLLEGDIDIKTKSSCVSRHAAKGAAALVASGLVENSPQALASFLRDHEGELDKTQVHEALNERRHDYRLCRRPRNRLPFP